MGIGVTPRDGPGREGAGALRAGPAARIMRQEEPTMSILIPLHKEEEERLRALADRENCPAEDLCREAVLSLLDSRASSPPADGYSALRRIIGIAKGGRDDGSIYHDYRPGEDE